MLNIRFGKKYKRVVQFNSLLFKIANGDEKALEELYNQFSGFIYSTAIRKTSSKAMIEEIVDDVVVKIWNAAPYQKYIDNPYGWIYAITLNSAKDHIKACKTYEEIFDVVAAEDDGIHMVEEEDSFCSMIACLDDDEERIVKLHLAEDYTFKEIARMEKKAVSTISSTYYRAIDKIRSQIEKY